MSQIKIENIEKSFGEKKVVKDISFEVNKGEILGILGPNGAGKTTTIRMIMGINAPDKGNIYFNLNGKQTEVPKNKIAYLPEERGLYKESRVMDILKFLASLKLVDKNKAEEKALKWLEKFDLADKKNSKIEELSKGMAQKIQFIASIIHEPDLVVLDEPFSGLDPVSQDLFKEEIQSLAKRGTAVLLSSHRLNMVEEICDRIFLINQGKKVLYDSLEQIKNKYGNYRVKIKSKQAVDKLESLTAAPEQVADYFQKENTWHLILKEQVKASQFLTTILAKAPVESLNISRISLHDIFVKVAKGGFDNENDL